MAKDKIKTGVPNKHLHARISYLQQAATYLTTLRRPASIDVQDEKIAKPSEEAATENSGNEDSDMSEKRPSGGLPQHLSNHLTQVARRSQIRLHSNVKHALCKRCGNILLDGETSTKSIENLSKGGKKPHADILVVECGYCGAQRRFPVGAQRQQKKSQRRKERKAEDTVKGNGDQAMQGD